jgi:hypothetical protein
MRTDEPPTFAVCNACLKSDNIASTELPYGIGRERKNSAKVPWISSMRSSGWSDGLRCNLIDRQNLLCMSNSEDRNSLFFKPVNESVVSKRFSFLDPFQHCFLSMVVLDSLAGVYLTD